MPEIDIRQNIMVAIDFSVLPTSTFSFPVNVEFVPDEMVVRQITFGGDNTRTGIFFVYTNMIGNYIGSFYDSSTCAPMITYQLGKPVGSNIKFDIHNNINYNGNNPVPMVNLVGPVPAVINSGILSIHLEFIKYKK